MSTSTRDTSRLVNPQEKSGKTVSMPLREKPGFKRWNRSILLPGGDGHGRACLQTKDAKLSSFSIHSGATGSTGSRIQRGAEFAGTSTTLGAEVCITTTEQPRCGSATLQGATPLFRLGPADNHQCLSSSRGVTYNKCMLNHNS